MLLMVINLTSSKHDYLVKKLKPMYSFTKMK